MHQATTYLVLENSFLLKYSVDGHAVEADNYTAINIYDWYAHLARFFDHFVGRSWILFDIDILIFDAQLIKVLLHRMAEATPSGRVDFNHPRPLVCLDCQLRLKIELL